MPTMIQRAALHFHHMDMGMSADQRSYGFAEANKFRNELLAAGFSEHEVDANGPLDRAAYFDEDGSALFSDDVTEVPEDTVTDHLTIQLANSPAELAAAVRAYLDVDPEGVLMVAADGMDALVLELHGPERVVWFAPDGEVKAAPAQWTVLSPAAN